MIVTADWVIPVASPPIRAGALLIVGQRIRKVGPSVELLTEHPRQDVHRIPGHVVMPGLVNAHTHLSLTALAGLLPEDHLAAWLQRVVSATRAMNEDDFADSAALGALQCLRCGTTCVGDIALGPESLSVAADAGLGGTFFWEVLGVAPSELPDLLAEREYPTDGQCGGRARCGLSPHSVYTAGPRLLREVRQVALRAEAGFAIHVAESAAESQLLMTGAGPLAGPAGRLAFGFKPPRRSPVSYLDSLGVLDGAVAIHCVYVDRADAVRLAKQAAGVVLCPRSNAHLGNGAPPVTLLTQAGVRLGLGTDSAASNEDLDLFAEARALRAIAPGLSPERTLRMMTVDGATILGLGDRCGTLAEGRSADLIAVRCESGDDPVETALRAGGRETVTAVMTGGLWRVLEGQSVGGDARVEKAGARVAAKVASVLGRRPPGAR